MKTFKKLLALTALISILITSSACFDMTMIRKDDLLNYYSNSANYKTYRAQIKGVEKNKYGAFALSLCICGNNDNEHTCNQTISAIIVSAAGNTAIDNEFKPNIGEFYLLTLSTKEFTKNWAVPVTAISSADQQTVYLNFNDGKQNWIDYIQSTSPY